MKRERVAIAKCSSYKQREVDKAVAKCLKLIDFDVSAYRGKSVLIKPNIVGSFPKKQIACTTNPAVVEAICKLFKKQDCKISIGDSPFTNPEASFKAAGIGRLKKYGKLIIFEQQNQIKIHDNKAKVLKTQELAKIIKEVDLIVNIPKLKTHSLTKYTGAIKNLYGCIPGGLKQRFHNYAKGEYKFSKLLVDIYQNIKPGLNIMDGVISMEGEGPTSGEAKKSRLILASKNAVALDIACCKLIGYNPKEVEMVDDAVKRKLYSCYDFELAGSKNLPKISFKKPTLHQISATRKKIYKMFKEKPITCNTKLCKKCGLCMKHCPGKAIKMNPYPAVDRRKCIRCFCCIEICPQDAMMIEK